MILTCSFYHKRRNAGKFASALVTFFLIALVSPIMAKSKSEGAIHIASFNVHYIVPTNPNEDWEERRFAVSHVLNKMDADIVAFQEMETFIGGHYNKENAQLGWVLATTDGYRVTATGQPETFPNTQPIIYKPDKFSVVEQGYFFFSDTPDIIYSRQWNKGYPYFCSWARFRTGGRYNDFYVFNIHNDFKSRSNRLKTSRLIIERMEKIVPTGTPVVVLGDFNAPRWFKEIGLIEDGGFKALPPGGSTHRIWGLHLLPAIDHILINRAFATTSGVKVWRNRHQGVYPADHYPISAVLMFSESMR